MWEIVLAVIGSGALSALISGGFGLLNRHLENKEKVAKQKNELEDLKKQLKKLEKDSVRTQLLLLMTDFPTNQQEIEEVAQHYFVDYSGNWYMTGLFSSWLTEHEYGEPEWFRSKTA